MRCPQSSILPSLRASTSAPNSRIASFAASDGCSDIGPTVSHLVAPPARVPTPGSRVSTSNTQINGTLAYVHPRSFR
jgi:hypothetical protein